MNNETLKLGNKKIPAPRAYNGKFNKKYYEPLYGTIDCTYTGGKRGRKTISEKLEIQEPKFKKNKGKYIHYFD